MSFSTSVSPFPNHGDSNGMCGCGAAWFLWVAGKCELSAAGPIAATVMVLAACVSLGNAVLLRAASGNAFAVSAAATRFKQ